MYRKQLIHSIFMATLIGVILSCSKDDTNLEGNNPTNGKTTAVFNPEVTYGTMTDEEGNIYKTITITGPVSDNGVKTGFIASQTWMAENLRITKYNDGTSIRKTSNSTSMPGYPEIGDGVYAITITQTA